MLIFQPVENALYLGRLLRTALALGIDGLIALSSALCRSLAQLRQCVTLLTSNEKTKPNSYCTMVQNIKKNTKNSHLIIYFPTSKGVSERANKWVQRSARAKQAGWSKRTSERCKQISERTSEWPSLYFWMFWRTVSWWIRFFDSSSHKHAIETNNRILEWKKNFFEWKLVSYKTGKIDEYMNEWMHEWKNEWMNKWMNEWMNGQISDFLFWPNQGKNHIFYYINQ